MRQCKTCGRELPDPGEQAEGLQPCCLEQMLGYERERMGDMTPEDFCKLFLAFAEGEADVSVTVLSLRAACMNALDDLRFTINGDADNDPGSDDTMPDKI